MAALLGMDQAEAKSEQLLLSLTWVQRSQFILLSQIHQHGVGFKVEALELHSKPLQDAGPQAEAQHVSP